jgi:hypothetical protein
MAMSVWCKQEVLSLPSFARSPAFTSAVSRKNRLEQPALAGGEHQPHVT